MAKKRTRQDKLKAAAKKQVHLNSEQQQYALQQKKSTLPKTQAVNTLVTVPEAKSSNKKSNDSTKESIQKMFGYPLTLLYKDLLKTGVVTLIIMGLLVSITVYVRF